MVKDGHGKKTTKRKPSKPKRSINHKEDDQFFVGSMIYRPRPGKKMEQIRGVSWQKHACLTCNASTFQIIQWPEHSIFLLVACYSCGYVVGRISKRDDKTIVVDADVK